MPSRVILWDTDLAAEMCNYSAISGIQPSPETVIMHALLHLFCILIVTGDDYWCIEIVSTTGALKVMSIL